MIQPFSFEKQPRQAPVISPLHLLFKELPKDIAFFCTFNRNRHPMQYLDLYSLLKTAFYKDGPQTTIPQLDVHISHCNFVSQNTPTAVAGSGDLCCSKHQMHFEKPLHPKTASVVLDQRDAEIECNRFFQYHVIQANSAEKPTGVILFFHGLNEKKWDKYLPWAYGLSKQTGKAVLLFPIAFHMDRAPALWSDRTAMFGVAQQRLLHKIDNSEATFVNAAISSRMESHPQRLFWSGLQTYSDVLELTQQIHRGNHPTLAPGADFSFFGYSIGAFLSLILLMSNPQKRFTNSKLFCFCGGMTLDRMFPISKYIMDAQASIAMGEAFARLLSSNFAKDPHLAHYQDEKLHPDESWFKTYLRYNYFQELREQRLCELHKQIKALLLKKDEVAPAVEALNTLQGGYRSIQTEIDIQDFPHPYSHVTPFPLTFKQADLIDQSYRYFMDSASSFLR